MAEITGNQTQGSQFNTTDTKNDKTQKTTL